MYIPFYSASVADASQNMKNIGNVNANEQWNPQRKQPPIPLDVDEVDSAMERYIRQKYDQKLYTAGDAKPPARSPSIPLLLSSQDTRSDDPVSLDDDPPLPPPKTSRKFGFGLRSASSGSFLSRSQHKSKKDENAATISSPKFHRGSRVFGATIGVTESDQGLEMKLLQLREMGFSDSKRNTSALKGNGGDLERTIESLVRLGEGESSSSGRISNRATPSQQTFPSGTGYTNSNGAAILRSPVSQQYSSPASTPRTTRSTNPFENRTRETSATSDFDAAMARMTISPTQPQNQQSLFPNATGGHLASPSQIPQASYQHSMTPPVSSSQYFSNNPYAQQPINNPFTNTQPASPSHAMSNFSTVPQSTSSNPFLQQDTQYQSLTPQYSTFSPQETAFSPQQQQSAYFPQSIQQLNNLNFQSQQGIQSPTFQPQPSNGYYNPYQQQMQPVLNSMMGRLDKSSIMALYNQPQPNSGSPVQMTSEQITDPTVPTSLQPTYRIHGVSPQRSATMPAISSNNPFTSDGTSAPAMPILYQQQQYPNSNYGGQGSANPFYGRNT